METQRISPKFEPSETLPLLELNRFMAHVSKQDDYALVLSLATFIEDTLGRVLSSYFRDCKATRDLIDGFNAPLGTLSSRIKAAYSFGLIMKQQFDDMEILRNVRNKFAHNWEGVSLEQGDIKALIGKLSGYTLDQKPIKGGNREQLLGSLSSCCIELQILLVRLETKSIPKALDISYRLTHSYAFSPQPSRSV